MQREVREIFRSGAGEFKAPNLGTVFRVGFFGEIQRPKIFNAACRVYDAEIFCAVPSRLGDGLPGFS